MYQMCNSFNSRCAASPTPAPPQHSFPAKRNKRHQIAQKASRSLNLAKCETRLALDSHIRV